MKLDLKYELELEKGEDAPMSMDTDMKVSTTYALVPQVLFYARKTKTLVCGVNSATDKLQEGRNDNCRLFELHNNKYVLCGLSSVAC
jgi:prolactin regulatory element-binding protein